MPKPKMQRVKNLQMTIMILAFLITDKLRVNKRKMMMRMIRNQMKNNSKNSKRKKNLVSLNLKKIRTTKLVNPWTAIILLLTSKTMFLDHSKTLKRIKHLQDVLINRS